MLQSQLLMQCIDTSKKIPSWGNQLICNENSTNKDCFWNCHAVYVCSALSNLLCVGESVGDAEPSLTIMAAIIGGSRQSPQPLGYRWYKQCKSGRCWEVKLSPREVSKDTLTTP